MSKNYATAPLPFQGQKRNFIKQFKEALKTYPEDSVYIDLFGGSGLLSHTVKQEKPNVKVIYNDYDNFKERLKAIPETNNLLSEIRVLVEHIPNKKAITDDVRYKILDVVKSADKKGYVDYITLSASLLFSMNYVQSFEELKKQRFYNRVRKSDYDASNYLNNVDFVRYDYKELFELYKNKTNVVFLVDPPYLSTDCSTYKNYWRLSDYLDVLKVLMNTNYFYFTSNKSSIVELCEWIETNTGGKNPFNQAEVVYHYNKTSHNTGYTDIMLHKRYTTTSTL
ncbi:DNA adenine methylase [Tenacibaculum sp. SSH1-16]|uniref:DNA adenine methylase n=1 Tax=Tenacibaculum sp. SSH1-16 TaxID=3136667 RepID=UPI0032C42F79